jgi:hypothetical protein
VVLSVAAMDNYFTKKFAEVLVPFLKKKGPTKSLTTLLGEAGLNTEEALIMLQMDRPYRRVGTLVRTHLSRYTTQHFEKIDQLFDCLGVKGLSKHAADKTKRKRLLASIRLLVKRRNEIAHEGDLNDYGKVQVINPDQTVKRIQDVKRFVEAANEIIDSAAGKKKAGKKSAVKATKAKSGA